MKKSIFLTLCILIISLCGCSKLSKSSLEIYVIKQSDLDTSWSDREIVKNVKEIGRLVFTGDDINGYNWETHTVTMKEESVSSHGAVTDENGGSAIFKVDDNYAYVIILDNSLIYTGGFLHGSKNPAIPLQPSISDIDKYSFKITFDSKYATGADPRNNKTLYSFLSDFGLLSSGTL